MIGVFSVGLPQVVPLVIDIDNDITDPAGDITSRKDITRPLVIAGVDDITKNRPAISPI